MDEMLTSNFDGGRRPNTAVACTRNAAYACLLVAALAGRCFASAAAPGFVHRARATAVRASPRRSDGYEYVFEGCGRAESRGSPAAAIAAAIAARSGTTTRLAPSPSVVVQNAGTCLNAATTGNGRGWGRRSSSPSRLAVALDPSSVASAADDDDGITGSEIEGRNDDADAQKWAKSVSPPPTPSLTVANSNRNRNRESNKNRKKESVDFILRHSPGTLSHKQISKLLFAIRHIPPEKGRRGGRRGLFILERILTEQLPGLKSMHVFSVLVALSSFRRAPRQIGARGRDGGTGNGDGGGGRDGRSGTDDGRDALDWRGLERLRRVVSALRDDNGDGGRQNENKVGGLWSNDVASFAAAIAADSSRSECTAPDVAAEFLEMMTATTTTTSKSLRGKSWDNNGRAWDPRIVGAVLNSFGRWGRADEARRLLEHTTGKDAGARRLPPAEASLCGDAVVRAYAKRAALSALKTPASIPTGRSGPKRDGDESGKAGPEAWGKRRRPTLSRTAESDVALAEGIEFLVSDMPRMKIPVTARTCAALLGGYAELGMGEEAELALRRVEFYLYQQTNSSSYVPADTACYNSVLHAYSMSCEADAAAQAGVLFKKMKKRTPISAKNDAGIDETFTYVPPVPDIISYASLLTCYGKCGMAREAEELLNSMIPDDADAMEKNNARPPIPSIVCYGSVMQAFERSEDADAPFRAIKFVEQMEERARADNADEEKNKGDGSVRSSRRGRHYPAPNRVTYTSLLRCLSRAGRGCDAEEVLAKFRRSFPGSDGPDSYAHNLVLKAWDQAIRRTSFVDRDATSGSKEKFKPNNIYAKRAAAFFDEMKRLSKEGSLPPLDARSYDSMFNIYAQVGMATEAENLLDEILEGEEGKSSSSSASGSVPPASQADLKPFNHVLRALSRSDVDDAVPRAWKIMNRLGFYEEDEEGDGRASWPIDEEEEGASRMASLSPSLETFNAMLRLFPRRGMAAEAEELLGRMDDLHMKKKMEGGGPNIHSYEAALEALAQCREADAPTRAEALITRMEVIGELGGGNCEFQPSLRAYNAALNCYANAGMAGKAERLLERLSFMYEADELPYRPDAISYGTTIKAIANSGRSAEIAVARMESLAKTLEMAEGGSGNEVIFTSRLKLLSKYGMGHEAERLLKEMEEGHASGKLRRGPSVIHYTAAMDAWAKNADENALTKAENCFESMKRNPDIQLDLASFHVLLHNYARHGMGQKAEELLERIAKLHGAGELDDGPDRSTYTMVIDAWNRSGSKSAPKKAEYLLNKMRELHATGSNPNVEPDDVTFVSVIRCKRKGVDIRDLTEFQKTTLMTELQIEHWPIQLTTVN